jgi:hypothetical protein
VVDNIFIERLWRSLKYEDIFLKAYGSPAEARSGIGAWLTFYNSADEGASPPSSWAHRPELLKVQPKTVH